VRLLVTRRDDDAIEHAQAYAVLIVQHELLG